MTDLFDVLSPSKVPELDVKAELARTIKNASFPKYSEVKQDFHPEVYAALRRDFYMFKGTVHNPRSFILWVELEDDNMYAVCACDQDQVELSIMHEDDIDFSLGPVLKKMDRRVGAARTQPNAKCLCGSGKKFKKCHGKYV